MWQHGMPTRWKKLHEQCNTPVQGSRRTSRTRRNLGYFANIRAAGVSSSKTIQTLLHGPTIVPFLLFAHSVDKIDSPSRVMWSDVGRLDHNEWLRSCVAARMMLSPNLSLLWWLRILVDSRRLWVGRTETEWNFIPLLVPSWALFELVSRWKRWLRR
jgi:hypothetical protein